MSIRMLPALGAGLILAACAGGNSPGQDTADPSGVVSTGVMTPGAVSDECGGAAVPNAAGFETDSATLTVEAQAVLQKQAVWLTCYAQRTITIEGHADERGAREYNLALGERRAQAVMNYLIALRVDPKRLKTISYGKERPVCTEAEETCWSQNRRGVSTVDS